jgi:DNA repair protein RadC
MAHPREVFAPAIKKGAAAVIVAHNHPSGDPEPSEEDVDVTLRLLEASRIVGIRLVDHVIVGRGSYTSMRDRGYIPDSI